MAGNVDIYPFVAQVTSQADEHVIYWDDARDIHLVEVAFACAVDRAGLPELHYWQRNWPKVRVAPNAVIGAGEQGWLPLDDWITGHWQRARVDVTGDGAVWRFAFQPVDQEDLPGAQDFPACFRRTLKLRFSRPGGLPAIQAISVFTDSTWREDEFCLEWGGIASQPQCWDGYLEAYNGHVVAVQALGNACEVDAGGHWHSCVNGDMAGVRARVRYAWNEDRNTYDRTILTLRSVTARSFSVSVNDVLADGTIYLPDLGVALGRSLGHVGLDAVRSRWEATRSKTIYQHVAELPEQTWERAWGEMPPKGRFYFVLGCEGARQKYRLEPNGDLLLPQNYIRKVPGRDSARLLWEGATLHYRFGLPDPAQRALLDGYLPIMQTRWATSPIAYRQEAFATWLLADIADAHDKPGDEPVVALLRFTLLNAGQTPAMAQLRLCTAPDSGVAEPLQVEDGWVYASYQGQKCLRLLVDAAGRGALHRADEGLVYEVALAPGEEQTLVLKAPFVALREPEEMAALARLDYDAQRARVADFWRRRVAQGMQIDTPNAELNRFHRAHLTHMLIVNDREPGATRRVPRCGGFHYGLYPDEGIMGTSDLDRRGYTQEAEQCLEMLLQYQGSVPLPGDFQSQDGVLYGARGYECGGYNRGQGWAMWGLAEHYRYTRDRAWLERVAPALIKACDWVTRERQRTMLAPTEGRRPISYGFLPAGSLEDVTDYWHWLSSNAYAWWGFQGIAETLGDISHPEASRLQRDSEAFRRDLMQGFNESQARSPVVKLGDGRYVPYYPPRLERRGRDFGWLREVLEGALGLLVSGLVPLTDPAAQWILDDYEDNLYLSAGYGYANSVPDYARYWFSRGGFSMQSNLLLHPAVYLRRDDVPQYLRAFFNGFASTYYPETCMLAEHALPTLADARGDHYKTSDESNVTHYLRLMLVEEHGQDLILGKAIPRAWLAHGQTVRVQRALTYFGPLGYVLRSAVDEGSIEAEIDLPQRNPPARAWLRLRHPHAKRLQRVEIDGRAWTGFDVTTESISLPLEPARLHLQAFYKA